jgi:hypothetical protein
MVMPTRISGGDGLRLHGGAGQSGEATHSPPVLGQTARFHTEFHGVRTEFHGEELNALRAKRESLHPWNSVRTP